MFFKTKPIKHEKKIFYTYSVGEPELSAGKSFWPLQRTVTTLPGAGCFLPGVYTVTEEYFEDRHEAIKKALDLQYEDDVATGVITTPPNQSSGDE